MNFDELNEAVSSGVEPQFTNDTERCLWLAGVGQWDESHDIVESLPEPGASWIHAMLHREEGDLGNAGYWYHRANQEMPRQGTSMKDEWGKIARVLLR